MDVYSVILNRMSFVKNRKASRLRMKNKKFLEECDKILDFCNDLETLNIDVYVVRTDNAAALFETETAYKSVGYSIIELIKNSGSYDNAENQLYNIRKRYEGGSTDHLPLVNVKNDTLILE